VRAPAGICFEYLAPDEVVSVHMPVDEDWFVGGMVAASAVEEVEALERAITHFDASRSVRYIYRYV